MGFFLVPEVNMRFLPMIYGEKSLQINLSKFPMSNCFSVYHVFNMIVLTKVGKVVKIATSEKHIFWPKKIKMF